MRRDLLILLAAVVLIRLPFVALPVQGDDVYYLLIAENARVDPLHPLDFSFRLQGETVWAAGHTRPPLNGLVLAALIQAFGDVRGGAVDEVLFHLTYLGFSLIAVFSMYALARRFTDRPLWAALMFAAVPALVVSGNKLEADLPLVAFWTLGFALFAHQRFLWSAAALALAGFTGYQAVLAVPILAHLAWLKNRDRPAAWVAVISAPLLALAWQLFERVSTGVAPAEVLGGYAAEYGLLALQRKLDSSLALLAHLGWIASPLLVLTAWRGRVAVAALLGGTAIAAFLPADYALTERLLYAVSASCGLAVLAASSGIVRRERTTDGGFLAAWTLVFFAGALALFYAGSARYLLLLAPAVVLLAVRATTSNLLLTAGLALQLALGLWLALTEGTLATKYRTTAAELGAFTDGRRAWTNAEWGLRYYLAQLGAEPLLAGQEIPQRGVVVESSLAAAIPFSTSGNRRPLYSADLRSDFGLRTIGAGSHSGFSSSEFGVLPFGFGSGIVDRIRAFEVGVPDPTLSFLSLADSAAGRHLLRGFYPSDGGDWRWMRSEGAALLLVPENAETFAFQFHIPQNAPGRKVSIEIDGVLFAERRYETTGGYTLEAPISLETSPFKPGAVARITLRIDKAYSPPGDARELGLVAIAFGFR